MQRANGHDKHRAQELIMDTAAGVRDAGLVKPKVFLKKDLGFYVFYVFMFLGFNIRTVARGTMDTGIGLRSRRRKYTKIRPN